MAEPDKKIIIVAPSSATDDPEFEWLKRGLKAIELSHNARFILIFSNEYPESSNQTNPEIVVLWQGELTGLRSLNGRYLEASFPSTDQMICQLVKANSEKDRSRISAFDELMKTIGADEGGYFKATYENESDFLRQFELSISEFMDKGSEAKVIASGYILDSSSVESREDGSDDKNVIPVQRIDDLAEPESAGREDVDVEGRVTPESVVGHVESDHATRVDTLGFAPYVRAVAMFLRHERTKAPFTMSIDGQWGCGKSSFMLQLQDELEGPDDRDVLEAWKRERPNIREGWVHPLTVWFNPWRHDKGESLWAAFALACMREIPKQLSQRERTLAWFRRTRRRMKKPGAQMGLAKTIGKYVVASSACVVLFLHGPDLASKLAEGSYEAFLTPIFGATPLAALLLVASRLWKLVEPVVKEPVASDLAKHLEAPDYASSVTFLDKFHDEFSESITDLVQDRRVYVFIDDLDRCEVPHSVELLQAINLLTGGDAPLFFVIGMDREKVAAGVAAKHKDVLEHLEGYKGLDFGYNFIQKFIQLPFRVPTPGVDQLEGMLRHVVGDQDETPKLKDGEPSTDEDSDGESVDDIIRNAWPGPSGPEGEVAIPAEAYKEAIDQVDAGKKPKVAREVREQRASQIQTFDEDSERVKNVIMFIAPILDYNPRRVKQFANLLRLNYYLAVETGLCDPDAGVALDSVLTVEQVGKFLAITFNWPKLLQTLKSDPHALDLWEAAALEENEEFFEQRSLPRDLRHLLTIFEIIEDSNGQSSFDPNYSLGILDVERMLGVSGRITEQKTD